MARAKLRTSIEDYILEEDRELKPEEQTVFKLKGLSAVETADLQDEMMDNKNYASQMLDALRIALVGWDNLIDQKDNQVKFVSAKKLDVDFSDVNFNYLNQNWIMELGQAVLNATYPEAADSPNVE